MIYSPADWRTGDTRFLLDLEWGGITYRLADVHSQPTIDGDALEYFPGLEFGGSHSERLDLFGTLPVTQSIDVTLHLGQLVDVPKRVSDGYDLGAARATLWLWVTGTTERRKLLSGPLRQADYGTRHEPVTGTIEEAPLQAKGRIPNDGERVGAVAIGTAFTDPAPSARGQFYPTIIGRPGGADGWGSPLLYEDMDSDPLLASTGVLAWHPCVGGSVVVVDDANDTEETRSIQAAATQWWQPHSQKTVVETFDHPATNGDKDNAYYVRWSGANAGGVPSRDDPSSPMRNAGEVISWLLSYSGARVDYGRMRLLEQQLAGFNLDAAIVPGKEDRISPTEWIHQHLLPILPVSAARSSEGLYYRYWDWEATANDAVVSLSADEHQLERVGAVEYSDTDSLYQAVRLDYAHDYRRNTFRSSMLYTGQQESADTGDMVFLSPWLQRSYRLHAESDAAQVQTLELASRAVMADETAHRVCSYLARRHALRHRRLRYIATREHSWLRPGDVVKLTDEDLHLTEEVALVDAASWAGDQSFALALLVMPRLGK